MAGGDKDETPAAGTIVTCSNSDAGCDHGSNQHYLQDDVWLEEVIRFIESTSLDKVKAAHILKTSSGEARKYDRTQTDGM